MRTKFTNIHDVVIAGAGVAAAFTALRLLDYGFRPLILTRRLLPARGAEAVPESILRWQQLIDVAGLLKQAGAVSVDGFEVDLGLQGSFRKSGTFFHVERVALARAALASAVSAGASLLYCEKLPKLVCEQDSANIFLENQTQKFRFAVDATGRGAYWSRPVKRLGNTVAHLFHLPQKSGARAGKIVDLGQKSWAYRIDLPDAVTVGVIANAQSGRISLDAELIRKLRLSETKDKPLTARRPAFPQMTLEVCRRSRISVGDAAFAHNPIAGQGVFSALSSATAAADVLRTCRDLSQYSDLAFDYYRDLINSEKRHHLSFLETFEENTLDSETPEESIDSASLSPTRRIWFSASVSVAGVRRGGYILPEETISLARGGKVRWLGEFDLLRLKQFCSSPVSPADLSDFLSKTNLAANQSAQLLQWCLSKGVLSASDLPPLTLN